MSYLEKLKDPRWQKLRLEVFNRDNFTCQNCGDDKETLNVHHLNYHGEPWNTPIEQLITLCQTCHQDESDSSKETEKRLISAIRGKSFLANSINEIAEGFENMEHIGPSFFVASAIRHTLSDESLMRSLVGEYNLYLRSQNDKTFEQ